jgi:multidrug efflux pump subunit AcrB
MIPNKEPNSIIAWLVKNKVTANIIMLIFLIGGVYMGFFIKKEVFPEFELDMVTISVAYPGASPEEVEQGVVLAIEEKIKGIEGVKQVTATAKENSAQIVAELLEKTNKNKTYQDIQQNIDSITTFPEDAEKPIVSMSNRKRRVVSLSVYGGNDPIMLREFAERTRDKLLQSSHISQVELIGVKTHEIEITLNPLTLQTYGLSAQNISDIIAKESVELSGGSIKTSAGELLLRVKTRKTSAEAFAQLPIITSANGASIRLGDIATLKEGFFDDNTAFTYNNQPAIELEIYRIGRETPKEVSIATRSVLESVEKELPSPYGIVINDDSSKTYDLRLELLIKNGLFGLALVLLILGLLLEFKLAFWVALGIPTSFLGSLLFLEYFGVSINMISMFAYIIALGIVVDDAIIVGENIYEYKQRGMSYADAAIQGTRDIIMPVSFSIITNIVAFIPLMYLPGTTGKIFYAIPVVVAIVFAISWIESLLILPAHLAFKEKTSGNEGIAHFIHEQQQRFADAFNRFVETYYRPFLRFCMANRYTTIVFGLVLLAIVLAYAKSGRLGFEMMPRVESNRAVAYVSVPIGAPRATIEAINQRIIDAGLKTMDEVGEEGLNQGYKSYINENSIQVTFYLIDGELRKISTGEFNQIWRKHIGKLAGIDSLVLKKDVGGPSGGRASLTVELSHRDPVQLENAAKILAQNLQTFSITKDIDNGITTGKRQIDFELLPLGQKLGLSAYEIARQVRYATYGKESIREQRGRNEMKVMVRLEENERNSLSDLGTFLIKTPSGGLVRLSEVASMIEGNAYTKISRRDGKRVVNVTANVEPERDTPQVIASLDKEFMPLLQQQFPELEISYQGVQADIKEGAQSLITSFVLVLAILYIMLAIPFASYTQPLIIMLAIPYGIVGAFLGHMLLGYSLSMISIMGIVALCGVVVNDTLVLVDYANQMRKEGHSAYEAVVMAATRRFRPIFLTTATTFCGLAPMIYETSIQAKFMIPMAISLGYGILFSTVISLVFVPAIYMMLEDVKHLFSASKEE